MSNIISNSLKYFHIRRCAHIFSENLRIEGLCEFLTSNQKSEDEKGEEIARLFNESYKSQKENFDCVTEEIENLRKIMLQYGVLGCRLASDGWGGNVIGISLVAKTNKIIEFIMNDYYSDPKNKIYVSDDLNMLIYQTTPGESLKFIDPQYEIWF